jgi:hypothetical protein
MKMLRVAMFPALGALLWAARCPVPAGGIAGAVLVLRTLTALAAAVVIVVAVTTNVFAAGLAESVAVRRERSLRRA